jgi:sensor histidine kinase YesM
MAFTPNSNFTIFRKSVWVDVVFWLAYGTFWHVVFAPRAFVTSNLLISGILTLWQAIATYAHFYLLLEPRFRKQLSTSLYAICIVPLVLFASVLSWASLYLFFRFVLGKGPVANFVNNAASYWQGAILGGMGMAVAITGAIYLFRRRREQEQREQKLEKARTEAELAYLRGQLNPHFLFNALNSIYFLIPKAPEEAQTALGGFSDLLRYQLYRSEEKLVPLAEELAHLRKFAELSRLRLEEDFTFAINDPANLNGQRVPPMLLLPLVENAIKYSPSVGGKVTGLLDIKDGRLHFTLTNKVGPPIAAPTPTPEEKSGGIGLVNIQRRLGLLFPDDHHFTILEQPGHYTVNLEIPLTK